MTSAPARPAPAPAADLLSRYDGRAPRYTSYPTALSFSDEVNETVYRDWLPALDPSGALSLYLHIPFCQRLCWYCGCNTRVVRSHDLISSYNRLLIDELGLLQAALPARMRVGQIHLGGGTPNMLSRDDMTDLFRAIRHVFQVSPGAEIAAELDPASLTREWVRAAAHHGLSRASLGVQDLTPEVQQAVNRIESFSVVEQAAGWLREVGVLSLNLDLMYGLPNQTTAGMLATLEQVVSLRPERLALFGYAHVPWARPHQKLIPADRLPGASERLDQSEAAAAWLTAEGYVRIGLDHFAREDDSLAVAARAGALHRNFQGYTTDPHEVLLGVGASSIGRLPQGFAQNLSGEPQWRAAVAAGRLPVNRGVALTDDDRFRGDIIERLMCDLRVDLAAVCAGHGRSLGDLDPAREALAGLIADGVAEIDGAVVRVTDAGRPFLRSVCQVFDVRSNDPGAHSRVV
ncbi:MAG: oxygen-independent coproporphyrinogen III oxidase [Caulobacter sp.]|nr:oxygen-independent coproporphyrinogen III oxidase [Caulobacter sp.]